MKIVGQDTSLFARGAVVEGSVWNQGNWGWNMGSWINPHSLNRDRHILDLEGVDRFYDTHIQEVS